MPLPLRAGLHDADRLWYTPLRCFIGHFRDSTIIDASTGDLSNSTRYGEDYLVLYSQNNKGQA